MNEAWNKLKTIVQEKVNVIPFQKAWTYVISYYDLNELMKRIESEVCNNDEQRKG